MRRKISRIKAMFYLYQNDLCNEVTEFDHFDNLLSEVDNLEYDEKLYKSIVSGVIENMARIDRLIAISLTNYTIDRLSYIDRCLLRIGTFEMLYTDTPKAIIINEIIDLSKEYSEIDNFHSSKFNNSLLDTIRKRIEANDKK